MKHLSEITIDKTLFFWVVQVELNKVHVLWLEFISYNISQAFGQ